MKHINDCWEKIEACNSINEVYRAMEEMPKWSGDWELTWNNGDWMVTNTHYDDDSREEDSRYLDLEAPDLILEENELWSRDMKTGDIEVDKDVFDDYVEDTYIKIMYSDIDSDDIYIYKMTYEDDNVIGMEFIGINNEFIEY